MNNDSRTSAELEREIDNERAQLISSLETLQERFSVEGITRQITEQVTRHGGEFGESALNSAKSNPMALALTGIGLAWMMFSDSRRNRNEPAASNEPSDIRQRWDQMRTGANRYGQRSSASAEDLRNRLHEGTERLSEASRSRVVKAREAAYRAQQEFERTASRGRKQITDFYSDQPMVAGAVAFALGAALGAGLPRTDTEDKLVGESSDHLFEEAERIFKEELDNAEKDVKSAASSASTPDASREHTGHPAAAQSGRSTNTDQGPSRSSSSRNP